MVAMSVTSSAAVWAASMAAQSVASKGGTTVAQTVAQTAMSSVGAMAGQKDAPGGQRTALPSVDSLGVPWADEWENAMDTPMEERRGEPWVLQLVG